MYLIYMCAPVSRESNSLLGGSYPERSVLYSSKTQKHHQVWLRSCWDHGRTALPGRLLQKDHPPIRSKSTRVLPVAKAIVDAVGSCAPFVQILCILRGLSWWGKLVPLCSESDGRHSNLSLIERISDASQGFVFRQSQRVSASVPCTCYHLPPASWCILMYCCPRKYNYWWACDLCALETRKNLLGLGGRCSTFIQTDILAVVRRQTQELQ